MNYTPEQQAVIDYPHPRIIVQANPGSGKSATLIERVKADQRRGMLASTQYIITYTVAAAEELRHRFGSDAPGFVGTTHAFCLMLIRQFGQTLGYTPDVRVIDEEESTHLLQEIADQIGIKKIDPALRGTDNQGSPQQIAAKVHLTRMRLNNTVDFQTMQLEAIRLLTSGIPLQFHGLYIDEAQDTSLQEEVLYNLVGARIKVAFGDINQSIFTWRGATGELMVNGFEFPSYQNNTRLTLSINHRSRREVIKAANNMRKRLSGIDNVAAPYTGDHGAAVCVKCWGALDQQMQCIKAAEFFIDNGQSLAILCRLNQQVDAIREAFAGHQLLSKLVEPPEDLSGPDARQALEALSFLNGSNRVDHSIMRSGLIDDHVISIRHQYQSREINVHTALRTLRLTPRQIRIAEVATAGGDRSSSDAILYLLEGSRPKTGSKLHIGTIHSAKGREWDHVILCGADADQWEDKGVDDVDKRRLFYVATTRARISVTYMHITDRPSKFVKEAITGV